MRAFLSHSSRDKGVVTEVWNELGPANAELDSETFDRGLVNVAAIEEALRRCTLYVLFLSKDALASNAVRYEALHTQELIARGTIDRFLVICLDDDAFGSAEQEWKAYNFVRRAVGPPYIARLIQHCLLEARAREKGAAQPFVGRGRELDAAKERLSSPDGSRVWALYISGLNGIGRKTFAQHLFRDVYPAVISRFPEVTVDKLDGYEEIYRKLSRTLRPFAKLSEWRARITGFAAANENGKASLAAQLLNGLIQGREALLVTDYGGLLDGDGGFQEPLKNILSQMTDHNRPSIIFRAQPNSSTQPSR